MLNRAISPTISDFSRSATVSVASVGVSPTECCAAYNLTRSATIRPSKMKNLVCRLDFFGKRGEKRRP